MLAVKIFQPLGNLDQKVSAIWNPVDPVALSKIPRSDERGDLNRACGNYLSRRFQARNLL